MTKWKKSRFNVRSVTRENELVLYNSFTGAIGVVPDENKEQANLLLRAGIIDEEAASQYPLAGDLIDNGYFVPFEKDEMNEAANFHNELFTTNKMFHLIIMPTEECNFRCVYCYESFLRGTMSSEVVEGVKNLIDKRIEGLDTFFISWFGGEPTEAVEVIEEISRHAIKKCDEYGVNFNSNITTNAYNLNPEVFKKLTECKITSYQITVDGSQEDHDRRRIKKGGGSTFNTIMSNLESMQKTNVDFDVTLRVNFDPENYVNMDTFLEDVKHRLKGDKRFHPSFHAVGKWGGDNDDLLNVCGEKEGTKKMFEMCDSALNKGFDLNLKSWLVPGGSVCYAAKPWSFVVGSDGTLYKCTVALADERNKVGKLDSLGNLNLNEERFNLWTTSNESIDTGCQKCFFRPSCQGAACPLDRILTGNAPCPTTKTNIKRILTTIS